MSDPLPSAATTDTPAQPKTAPPTPWSERVKSFIGDLARPFQTYATSGAASWAIIIVARKVVSNDAAIFIGAVLAGVGAIFVGKAWENVKTAQSTATVGVAQAQAGATPPA